MIDYTGLPTKDETSETIVRNLYIHDSFTENNCFFTKSLNKPLGYYI